MRGADTFAARTIDLDLVLYGDAVIAAPDLRVPDPELAARVFIAAPLLELAPDIAVPGAGVRLDALMDQDAAARLEAVDGFTALLRRKFPGEQGTRRGIDS